jgi:regulator of RNase E activity RraB
VCFDGGDLMRHFFAARDADMADNGGCDAMTRTPDFNFFTPLHRRNKPPRNRMVLPARITDHACDREGEMSKFLQKLKDGKVGALAEELAKNQQTLAALARTGDVPTALRMVDHFVYFDQDSCRQDYAMAVVEHGYIAELLDPTPKSTALGVLVRKQQCADRESIDEAVIELFQLAELHDGEYDGWGCAVVHADNRGAK